MLALRKGLCEVLCLDCRNIIVEGVSVCVIWWKVPWWKSCRLGKKVGVSIHVKWGAKSITQMGWLTRVFGDWLCLLIMSFLRFRESSGSSAVLFCGFSVCLLCWIALFNKIQLPFREKMAINWRFFFFYTNRLESCRWRAVHLVKHLQPVSPIIMWRYICPHGNQIGKCNKSH